MSKLNLQKNRLNVTIFPDFYEKGAWKSAQTIAGMDEVGRGCLAGPVVAAAVILPINTRYHRLKDSKKMSKKDRVIAYKWIKKNCISGVGIINHRLIDKYNIYQTTIIAMKKALSQLITQIKHNLDVVVVDAISDSFEDILCPKSVIHSFIKGEDYSRSIAAASILAKETRDAIMDHYAKIYPQYGFDAHSGYGTTQHIAALDKYGKSLIHRDTFLQKYYQKKQGNTQQELF